MKIIRSFVRVALGLPDGYPIEIWEIFTVIGLISLAFFLLVIAAYGNQIPGSGL